MLAVLLKILSIIGIVLLVILGILVLLLMLVLFVPVCYRIKGNKNEQDMSASAVVTWLLGIVRVSLTYPEPGEAEIRIFGIKLPHKPDDDAEAEEEQAAQTVAGTDPEKANVQKTSSSRKDKKASKQNKSKDSHADKASDGSKRADNDNSGKDKPCSDKIGDGNSDKEALEASGSQSEEKKPASKKGLFAKISDKIKAAGEKFKELKDSLKSALSNAKFYKDLVTHPDSKALFGDGLSRLWKILKKLMPRVLRANILFGAKTPDITGYVYGAYAVVSSNFNKKTEVTFTPDFEREILEGNIFAKGHLFLAYVVGKVIPFLLNRKLWAFIDKYKSHDKIGEENGRKDE